MKLERFNKEGIRSIPDVITKSLNLPEQLAPTTQFNEVLSWAKGAPQEGKGGHWSGERGNSEWKLNEDETPSLKYPEKYNPDGLTNKQIANKFDDGNTKIKFSDGDANFEQFSLLYVKVANFTDIRAENFDQADKIAADEVNYGKLKIKRLDGDNLTSQDIRNWRKENGYTWHERKDFSMQLIPLAVHEAVPHHGGVAKYKKEA